MQRESDPDSAVFTLPYEERPKARLYLEALAAFHRGHWQWFWAMVVAVLSLLVAVLSFR